MTDVMIVAKFNASRFYTLTELETVQVRAQANQLFGEAGNAPADEINWLYIGTPTGGFGGWVAIITEQSYENFTRLLKGSLSKIFDIEISFLNRTYFGESRSEVGTVATIVPAGHDWK